MPLTKWQSSKIVSGRGSKRTPEQQEARDKIASAYKSDRWIPCPVCGYDTRHVWDGSAWVCACGAQVEK